MNSAFVKRRESERICLVKRTEDEAWCLEYHPLSRLSLCFCGKESPFVKSAETAMSLGIVLRIWVVFFEHE